MKECKEGIYFDMPEEEYHALPYFSRSMVDKFLIDEEEAWYHSPHNPDRPEIQETAAMSFGTAVHSMILEPGTFKENYVKFPCKEDYSDKQVLDTLVDLKDFLESVGEKKSGKKEELMERAEPYIEEDRHVVWEHVIRDFNADVELNDRRILSESDIERLNGISESLELRDGVKEILSKGYPEVTIIWKDDNTGIMCKCRIDYLRAEAVGELKTFSLLRGKNIYKAMCDAVVYEHYNMQFYVYSAAINNIIPKILKKKAVIEGDVNGEWLAKFLSSVDKPFFIIFVRTAAPYQIKAIEMQKAFQKGATTNVYFSEAQALFEGALEQYSRCLREYGFKRWRSFKEVDTLIDEHVPNIMYQNNNY